MAEARSAGFDAPFHGAGSPAEGNADVAAVPNHAMNDPPAPDPDRRTPLAAECRRCPALAAGRERICWGEGPDDAPLVVVGEAPAYGHPGADRWRGGNWTGMAYSGRRSGRKIRGLIADLGYDAYYTNAVKCFPSAAYPADRAGGRDPDADPTDNREPTSGERTNCRPYLRREIDRVGPDCVVATGRHATESLLAVEDRRVDSFLEIVLDVQECPALGVSVLPLLHPSYQEVWVERLGYSPEQYRSAVGAALAAVVD